jgi:hypothetical protein
MLRFSMSTATIKLGADGIGLGLPSCLTLGSIWRLSLRRRFTDAPCPLRRAFAVFIKSNKPVASMDIKVPLRSLTLR